MDDQAFGRLELDKVLLGIAAQRLLPALAPAVREIAQRLDGDDTRTVQDLARTVLTDPVLTERVLRVANSAAIGISGGVRTVTQAVFVLGFDTIRSAAQSLLTLDQVDSAHQREVLALELAHAVATAQLAGELATHAGLDAESATVFALMRSLGRLATAAWAPHGYLAAREQARLEGIPESEAARRLLGKPFHEIAQLAARTWGYDESFTAAVGRDPNACEGALQAAALSAEIVDAAAQAGTPGAPRVQALLDRAAEALGAPPEALRRALPDTLARADALCGALALRRPIGPDAQAALHRLHDTAFDSVAELADQQRRDEAGRPRGHRDLLRLGTASLARAAARGEMAEALLERAAETLHHAMGFRRTLIALRDEASGAFRPRAARGADAAAIQRGWALAVAGRDLLLTAIERNVSLNIADATTDKIRAALPAGFAERLPEVASFVLLPLRDAAGPIGFIYADRDTPDRLTDAEDVRLLAALKDTLLPALRRGH